MRRQEAARTYRPKTIRLLLVAESPPEDENRYFYFEGDETTEPLFDQVSAVLFEDASGGDKASRLKELRRRGVFLVELKPDAPTHQGAAWDSYVAPFLLNLETMRPAHIVVIGSQAHAAMHGALEKAELPLVDVQVPSPEHEVRVSPRVPPGTGAGRAGESDSAAAARTRQGRRLGPCFALPSW
jgi:hypothetical protein